jgi:uncharacterized integral membrane protein (TIGR00698 family)
VSPVLLALVLGMAVRNLIPASSVLRPGTGVVIKKWLPLGIVLLGARLDFYDLLAVGLRALFAAMGLIALVLLAVMVLTRLLNIPSRLGLLIGVGTAICGTSAIVATAPIIEAEEDEVGLSVATVNLFGVLAMLTFPAMGALFEMDAHGFGAWCGLSIHATPQVIAAGFAHYADGATAGEIATIVKLTRVSLLAPAVFLIGLWYARIRRRSEVYVDKPLDLRSLVPGFMILFLAMALLRTLGFFPEVTMHMTDRFVFGGGDLHFDLAKVLGTAAKWVITSAMAAVGLGIEIRALRAGGVRPFVLGLLATLLAAALGFVPAMWLL